MSYNIDYTVVKKPHHDKPLTPEQEDEWLTCALDKYHWMENYVWIQTDQGRELFKPRDYQRRIIGAASDVRFTVNLLGRQSGKCSGKNTKYMVRCKSTGEIYELTAEQFHEVAKSKRDC